MNKLSERFVFWVGTAIVVVLVIFFTFKSWSQFDALTDRLTNPPDSMAEQISLQLSDEDASPNEFWVTAALEHDARSKRYHLLQSFLHSRTWIRFMSMSFGAVMIAIGSVFVLARINTPQSSQVDAGLPQVKLAVNSSSPGVIMAALGVLLMLIPNISPTQEIDFSDGGIYLSPEYYAASLDTESGRLSDLLIPNE